MIKFRPVILSIFIIATGWVAGYAQSSHELPSPGVKESHLEYIHIVREADSLLFSRIVNLYENWITERPSDLRTRLEYCKFLEKVYYDDYDEYNPKYEKHQECLDSILAEYPDETAVIIYNARFVTGDSAIEYLESLTDRITEEPEIWNTEDLWQVYEKLAYEHSFQGNHGRAQAYGYYAMQLNKELDLSLLLARQYIELSDNSKALAILTQHIDSTNNYYTLYEKGELLYELEAYDLALKAFEWSSLEWDMDAELGKTLVRLGRYDEARTYLLNESTKIWSNRRTLEELFLFDLEHSLPDSALASYNRMRDLGVMTDPLLIYRIKLAAAGNGLLSDWQWRDLMALPVLATILVIIFLIPYLWILPIYSYGMYKREQLNGVDHPASQAAVSHRWALKDFWLISTVYLFLVFAITSIYDYSNLLGNVNDDLYEEIALSQASQANSTIFFIILMALATLFFLRKDDVRLLWGDNNSKVRQLMTGLGFIVVLRIFYGIFNLFFSTWFSFGAGPVMNITENILAIDAQYGFFLVFVLVVLLVPIYEEVIFRGIILSGISKYLSFHWANLIQSVMFALLHQDIGHFFYYVIFGLLAGHLKKRTGGLAASIIYHVINNLIAIIVINSMW